MYFTIKREKEITEKAKGLGGYYTAEFAIGYMMTYYPLEFVLDIVIGGIPPVIIIGLIVYFL